MASHFQTDVKAILDRDPAARGKLEVALCYPSFKAVRRHRRAHWLWSKKFKLLARLISRRTCRITGIDIHPGAVIGEGLFIDHGVGVVIGETATIGDNVTLYQGVTLGGTGKDAGKRHPTICDGVLIGAGAKVLGPFTVGKGAKIGAGAVVLKEVPPHATVVGNPGRVVRMRDVPVDVLDHINLPDPVKERIEEMTGKLEMLERCIKRMSEGLDCSECEYADGPNCAKYGGEVHVYEDL
jgi:serine O-acetyltransferase